MSAEVFSKYFSNFSAHKLEYEGMTYPTAEHAYHCQRYDDASIIEGIIAQPTARQAWEISQRYKDRQRAGFPEVKVKVMKWLLRAKAEQHEDVRKALLESGQLEIVKEEPQDGFWGNGPDGSGRNEMGKIWMEIRTEIAAERKGKVQ